ncbi:hypothetical protein HY732_04340 [Candidatus Uhrbacteria bacterium]|nr:hypothetical protein [Candidatus Uhrbacteria bacterium]
MYIDGNDLAEHFTELSKKYPNNFFWKGAMKEMQRSVFDADIMSQAFQGFIRNLMVERMKSGELSFNLANTSHVIVYAYPMSSYLQGPDTLSEGAMLGLFYLDVGGGLKKYRAALLKGLARRSESARQRIWNKIYGENIYRERLLHNDEAMTKELAKQFPKTFAEACRYYIGESLPRDD